MARILTRPLFRKGGLSRETGILSGLDAPRRSYAGGGNIGGGFARGIPMGSRTGFQQLTLPGMEGPAQNVAKRTLMERLGGKTKGAIDFFKKGYRWGKGGLGSLLRYAPAASGTAIAAPVGALTLAAASPFIAQAAATKQRKKGMYTPEGESYDPETGEILGGPNVDELGFTEQELAGSEAYHPDRPLTPKEMKEARAAKLKELQKEQISARIKRGDPVDANIAQDLGINIKTATYDKNGGPSIINGDKFTGDVESD